MTEKDDRFKVYIDQLHDGHIDYIDESFDSAFLGVNETSLSFNGPVTVKGEAYVAGNELVLHLSLKVASVVPCIICNAPVKVDIFLPNFYEAISLKEVPHGVFFMQETLRQAILLESKAFAECNGSCPHRKELDPYIKKASHGSPFDQLQKEDYNT